MNSFDHLVEELRSEYQLRERRVPVFFKACDARRKVIFTGHQVSQLLAVANRARALPKVVSQALYKALSTVKAV